MRLMPIILSLFAIGLTPVPEPAPEPAYMSVSNLALHAGDPISTIGSCPEPGPHEVTSPGFVAPIPLGGHGQVVTVAGDYRASMRCGDQTLTSDFMVRPVGYAQINLSPLEVQPGGVLTVFRRGSANSNDGPDVPYRCGTNVVTSPGFVAPIRHTEGGIGGWSRGFGTAIQTPGVYIATQACADGRIATATFRILGTPPVPQPPNQTRPQIPIKPKGAPETGGDPYTDPRGPAGNSEASTITPTLAAPVGTCRASAANLPTRSCSESVGGRL